jgi:hypothetical protein
MNTTSLAERREHLLAQSAAQRSALARDIEVWRKPLAMADQGLAALRSLKRHPAWIAAGLGLLVSLRPGRVGKWLRYGWVSWQLVQQLRSRR